MNQEAFSTAKRIPDIWARVWKAAFHEGRNLHCCAAAESPRAICGISISTDLVHDSPAAEDCCHECWRKVEEIANYWEIAGFPEVAEAVREKLPSP